MLSLDLLIFSPYILIAYNSLPLPPALYGGLVALLYLLRLFWSDSVLAGLGSSQPGLHVTALHAHNTHYSGPHTIQSPLVMQPSSAGHICM